MDRKESTLLLNRLREWATSEPFHYSHQWSPGDMVMWDNTGTLHRATPYPLDSGGKCIEQSWKAKSRSRPDRFSAATSHITLSNASNK